MTIGKQSYEVELSVEEKHLGCLGRLGGVWYVEGVPGDSSLRVTIPSTASLARGWHREVAPASLHVVSYGEVIDVSARLVDASQRYLGGTFSVDLQSIADVILYFRVVFGVSDLEIHFSDPASTLMGLNQSMQLALAMSRCRGIG